MRRLASICLCAVLAACASVDAVILRVPSEFPTIQSAFNAVDNGDTIIADVGEYLEALVAPNRRFTLFGNVPVDTGDYLRPVIDASSLPDSIVRCCLTLPSGSDVTVERFRFRNRNGNSVGVRNSATSAAFKDCAYDTVRYCLTQEREHVSHLTYVRCVIRKDSVGIYAPAGNVQMEDCEFIGGWGWARVDCGRGSRISRTRFGEFCQHYWLTAHGTGVEISDCIFGPGGPHAFIPVALEPFAGSVTGCVFQELELYSRVLNIEAISDEQSELIGNTFQHNRSHPNGVSLSIDLDSAGLGDPFPIVFRGNSMVACTTRVDPKGCTITSPVEMSECRFFMNGPTWASVLSLLSPDTFVCWRSSFWQNAWTVVNLNSPFADARDCWWGDSSGPFHLQLNPDGMGDQVGDNVLFEPWAQDTLEWLLVDRDLPEIPGQFELNVFPNPFNAQARIRIRVPEPEILRLDLYDLLGRQVKEIWKGAVAIEKEITLNADGLPSGVYFVRATQTIQLRPLATEKLVLLR